MARGRAIDLKLQLDVGLYRLLERVFVSRGLTGWPEIRAYMALLGFAPPAGPSISTLQRWRRERKFPITPGTRKIPPYTTDLYLHAWALEHYGQYDYRARRRSTASTDRARPTR